MKTLWFEFTLTLRRIFRRPTQNGLLLVTFAISVTLSVLTWSLFRSVHLSTPDFDPKDEYYALVHSDTMAVSSRQMNIPELEAYEAATPTLFADFAPLAFYVSNMIETPQGQERVLSSYMSARALHLTGARPIKGALFEPADDVYKAPGKVLLSERLWINGYGSNPDILGKSIDISGYPATIVGVLPASYRFPNDQDMWISLGHAYDHRDYPIRSALVKLKSGVSRERALADLRAIQSTLPPDTPALKRGELPALMSFRDLYLFSDLRVSALILFALSLLFVTVSCANAANLMIIDFLGRRSEVASNLALGIPRSAAIRGICWQVGLIALASCAIAITILPAAGPWLFDRIQVIMAPYWLSYQFAWDDVSVTLLIAGIAALVTVTTPIIYLLLLNPEKIIREHGGANRGTSRTHWRRVLLTGQIALLTVLGICSALLVRSKNNVGPSHWGYDASRVFQGKSSALGIRFDPSSARHKGRFIVHRHVLEEIRRRPETAAAAFAENAPGYSNGPYLAYAVDPKALADNAPEGEAFFSRISNGYFATLGVSFVTGSDFPWEISPDAPPQAILSESLARKLWGREDAIGQVLHVRYPQQKEDEPPVQLVVRGIVRDFQASGPRAKTNDAIFTPYTLPWGADSSVNLYVRDQGVAPSYHSINAAVHRADPRVALYFPSTINRQIELMLNSVRMTTDLTTIFAIAAVLLCAIGVYSLTVTQVLQSSREFGIRMALGAEPHSLWQTFTKGHLLTACVGVLIGIIGASQLIRVLESLLFGVNARDPFTYIGVALAILAVAALACLPSLRRLKRINPADCLRSL